MTKDEVSEHINEYKSLKRAEDEEIGSEWRINV